jgi:hypothetical protein
MFSKGRNKVDKIILVGTSGEDVLTTGLVETRLYWIWSLSLIYNWLNRHKTINNRKSYRIKNKVEPRGLAVNRIRKQRSRSGDEDSKKLESTI